ncbi:MAG: methyltransferase domain-containing protein [Candidatus Bathyarchaeota archaeon]|nr:methyltransferase domain-containing protein [Candidatus Bathyarchaeota archaeon]
MFVMLITLVSVIVSIGEWKDRVSFLTVLLFILLFLLGFFIVPLIVWGAPFDTSDRETVKKMVALANIQPCKKAADLGSGDGRVVIALAKAGAEAHGYEINPLLVWWARRNIRKAGLTDKASIHWKSFWRENFVSFDAITVFGVNYIMKDLEKKLRKELKTNARVVSNTWPFPTWSHSRKEGNVYLYEQK